MNRPAAARATAKLRVDKYRRHKIIAIPLLGLVLVYVLFSGDSNSPTAVTAQEDQLSTISHTPDAAGGVEAAVGGPAAMRDWPEDDLTFLESSNPFSSYTSQSPQPAEPPLAVDAGAGTELVKAETQTGEMFQSPLADQPLRYSFRSEKQHVVMIGEQLISGGSQLTDESVVEEIRDGHLIIRLTPARP